MKIVIDIDDKDYAMLKNTSITPDWDTLWHGKEKDKALTFAMFNLVKALAEGTPYKERSQGEWIYSQGSLKCSRCGYEDTRNHKANSNFCSKCGAEMQTKEENPCPCIECTSTDKKRDCPYCMAWAKWSLE